jgi:hypothetical protein
MVIASLKADVRRTAATPRSPIVMRRGDELERTPSQRVIEDIRHDHPLVGARLLEQRIDP